MANDVSARLKAVRLMHGLSQRELAKRAGVTNGMISLIEQGRVGPSVASLKKVDRKSTRLNSSHIQKSRMPSSA